MRQEVDGFLVEAQIKLDAYAVEMEKQRADAQRLLADALASRSPAVWERAYIRLFYMVHATVKVPVDGRLGCTSWYTEDVDSRRFFLRDRLMQDQRNGLPEDLLCYGRLTSDLCWELLRGPKA